MIFRSPYPDVTVPAVGLSELVLGEATADDAERVAIVDATSGESHRYGGLLEAVGRVAGALGARGIGRGDVAALFAPNCAAYPLAFHGILSAGAAASPVNALYTPADLAHQLRDAGARILFSSPGGLERARAAVAEPGVRVTEIVVLGDPAPGGGPVPETRLADLLASHAPVPRVAVDGDDLAALPYSSGTTGLPKGVQLTHRNLVANVLQMHPLVRIRPGSGLLTAVPLFHIYGLTGIMNHALLRRGCVVTMPRFDLAGFLAAIAQHRVDHVFIAPPVALALAHHPLVDEYDLSSVEIVMSAAAPLDTNLAKMLEDRLGATVVQGYGLTESSPCTHGIPVERTDLDRGSIGVPMPNVEARVVDPGTGEDVAVGERGELWCRGPNVMRGYLNNPGATATAVDEQGWLHTGDLVTVDTDGAFHVVDRLKELIKYKGYQVAPAELEAVLLGHEGVADAAVIGVRNADGEEVPKAFVVRVATFPELDADAVMEFVAATVAPYKKVRAVEFVDAIPRSAAGKILRKELRAREAAPVVTA
ncbi:AMP-binding protein [Pseudonocardia sp. DSM 110487]|uniref:AMP-binding protein n=1 Tax=Pseudonocardia sp. DSM 110487 TaxID=2865833 RepID=UPI001C695E75|nr:AMP-binding protein [Pseudonocardia sp. DSM 110487]QYN34021.1 AMP-binding protein [Pseudonocardia sp. DSM 110487]